MEKVKILNKVILFLFTFILLFVLESCATWDNQGNINGNVWIGYNLSDLNNYGDWVNTNSYGRAWRPFVVNNWMPFDNGHWAYANGNWTWVSYEPFGWIVYHYGYWYDDPFYGWVWIPSDGNWTPANVMWFDYGNYIGWAPLPPRGITYGYPWERDQNKFWHVVRSDDFTKDNIRDYRVTNLIRDENGGRKIFNRPPERQIIERNFGRPISEVNMPHETIKLRDRNIERMNLPQQENQRVEKNSPRVRRDILVPRERFQKQQIERREAPERRRDKR